MASKKKAPETPDDPAKNPVRELAVLLVVFGVILALIYGVFAVVNQKSREGDETRGLGAAPPPLPPPAVAEAALEVAQTGPTNRVSPSFINIYDASRKVLYWWDEIPPAVRQTSIDTGVASNIRPTDYAGPQACLECHPKNHKDWMSHSHRLMNALATPDFVAGDFSGESEIEYLGGKGSFYREGDRFFMRLERAGAARVFGIERTIGSRFYQYYVGKLIEGPEPEDSKMRKVEHILPFGYWLDKREWVPTVHVFRDTRKDDDNYDPYSGKDIVSYDRGCASCHTTLAAGDWMMRSVGARRMSKFTPRSMLFDVPGYLEDTKPDFVNLSSDPNTTFDQVMDMVDHSFHEMPIREKAITLGVSCEACHNGCQQHVAASSAEETKLAPLFFPASPHVFSRGSGGARELGRTDANRNFICAKCHTGDRPKYAGGQDTWNSTEFSDAVGGACYSHGAASSAGDNLKTLTCVHCHDPHQGIGKKWKLTPAQDDQKCIACHQQFEQPAERMAHTHHAPGSTGSSCMNCHMPKINEGMQDMVRTHHISKPTAPEMIEANQPNACNLCHLDKPIDWTLGMLRARYGEQHVYLEKQLKANYPDRGGPVGRGWLKSPHAPTRLAAGRALTKANARWALSDLLDGLNDDHLINRQFLQAGLDEMLKIRLKEQGYQFYMDAAEREEVVIRLKAEFQK